MDTPVKERLIGAVILVLLLVILVPELLSGPQPAKPQAAAGQNTPVRTYTIDLSGKAGAPAKAGSPPQTMVEPASKPALLPPAPAGTARDETEKALPEAGAATGPTSAFAPAPRPRPTSVAASAPAPEPRPSAATVDVPAAAPVQGAGPSNPSENAEPETAKASGSGWVVQLGSFSKSENAERLVKQLKGKHYKAFVSRAGTGTKTRYRVRVGPEKDRGQVQKLAERLKRDGQQVSIIPQP